MVLPILVIAVGLVSIRVNATERITNKVNEIKEVVLQVITDTAKPTEKLKLKSTIDKSSSLSDTLVIKDDFKEALFIIDGKTVSWEEMKNLKPDDLFAINVLKGDKATEYGMAGKKGVILIQTKFAANQPPIKIAPPPPPNIVTPRILADGAYIAGTNNTIVLGGKNLLFIINGVRLKKNEINPMDNIDANDIERVEVLKNKSALILYGKEGEDGVVLITTKSGIKSTIKTGYKIPTVVNVPNYQKNDTIIKSPQFPGGEDAWKK
jgi:TonB-dependent SusC/RagA subfamily outer membrane receptor